MSLRTRLARTTLIVATAIGLAASTGTAAANPSETGLANRSDNRSENATNAIDDHRPAGAGTGRKVG